MTNKPIKQCSVYSENNPRGYDCIKVCNSKKSPRKYSFSIAFGSGVISKCPNFNEYAPYQFRCFDTPNEAITATKSVFIN